MANLCVFCYKRAESQSDGVSRTQEKFLKSLTNYIEQRNPSVNGFSSTVLHANSTESTSFALSVCTDCTFFATSFSDTFQKFTNLQHELDSSISNFRNVLKQADKVPSRVVELKQQFVEKPEYLETFKKNRARLKKFCELLNFIYA